MASPQQTQKQTGADEVRLFTTPVRPPEMASNSNSIQKQIAASVPMATETSLPATPPARPATTSTSLPRPVTEMRAPDEVEQASIPVLPRVVIVGCSGHARVVVDILEQENRCRIVGLLDSVKPPGTEVLGYQVIGSDEDLPALVAGQICDGIIVAIGDNWVRSRMSARIKQMLPHIRFVSALHPSAQIAMSSSVGPGTVIMAGVVVNPGCHVGESCILNTGSSLDHDSRMEDFSSLAPHAVTGGGVRIGACSAIAIGAVVSHSIRIGDNTVVGAGATVLRDIPDRVVAYGSPAKIIRSRLPGDAYLGEPAHKPASSTSARVIRRPLESLALIPSNNPEWSAYTSRAVHDFFHTAEYHRVAESFGRGAASLAVYGTPEKFVAWPYILQDIEGFERSSAGEYRDVTSVYGYTGPLIRGCENDEGFLADAWSTLVEAWRSQSVVSVFTRLHPLLGNHRWLHYLRNDCETPQLLDEGCGEGKTVAIDLQKSPDEIWASYKRQLRQALRRLMSLPLETAPDPEWNYFDDFLRLYYSTMKRNSSASFYIFPSRQLKELRNALGSHGSLMVTKFEGQVVAAALLVEYDEIVNVHLLATDDRFTQLSPSKLLVHEAQLWARARGNRFLHLGGGRGSRSDDSLFRFKSLFSEVCYPFFTCRWILDRGTYNALTAERQKFATKLRVGTMSKNHFPAYRAPFQIANVGEKLLEPQPINGNPEV
jgi:sugar O-acyltransferase (sialic acid O-acetyltransferase NeuD family)